MSSFTKGFNHLFLTVPLMLSMLSISCSKYPNRRRSLFENERFNNYWGTVLLIGGILALAIALILNLTVAKRLREGKLEPGITMFFANLLALIARLLTIFGFIALAIGIGLKYFDLDLSDWGI